METQPNKQHRPKAASLLALAGVGLYGLSMVAMSSVHHIVVSVGFVAIVLAIVWFALALLAMELSYEFHAKRKAGSVTGLTILAILILEAASLTALGWGGWLGWRLQYTAGVNLVIQAFLTLIWLALGVSLMWTAIHIFQKHTTKRRKTK